MENLTAGLSPFLVCTGLSQDAAAARDQSVVYQLVHAGSAAPTLDQLRQLVTSAPSMPRSMLGLMVTFQSHSVLIDVLFGVNHRHAVAYRNWLREWEQVMLDVEVHFEGQIGTVIPLFLRFVQLSCLQYYNIAARLGAGATLPNLSQLINTVQFRNWQALPPLPRQYFAPPAGGALPAPVAPPAVAPVAPSPRPPAVPPPNRPAVAQEQVTNVRPDRDLMARFERNNAPLRQLTTHASAAPLPMDAANACQICLSYHLRGSCYSACRRTSTHRMLTDPEKESIRAFLGRVGVE